MLHKAGRALSVLVEMASGAVRGLRATHRRESRANGRPLYNLQPLHVIVIILLSRPVRMMTGVLTCYSMQAVFVRLFPTLWTSYEPELKGRPSDQFSAARFSVGVRDLISGEVVVHTTACGDVNELRRIFGRSSAERRRMSNNI